MARYVVEVEEQGLAVRTTMYEYEAASQDEALWQYTNGDDPVWAWVDTEDFHEETHETIVDIRLVEETNA